jgi:predicted transposase/invertase (TIGR01784 family)
MSQDFDKIFKENITGILIPLSKKLLDIDIVNSRELNTKLQTTLEREPDYLSLVETSDGNKFILHLEFQSTNDDKMLYRMQEYFAILRRQYNYAIKQMVIYLGKAPIKMINKLDETEIFRGFDLVNLNQVPFEHFMQSDKPEELILSILGDLQDVDPEEVLFGILTRLKETNKSTIMFQKYVKQLLVLSRLRNLSKLTKNTIDKMPIIYDVKQDAFYQDGFKEGKQEGKQEGKIEEKIRMEENRKSSVIRLIKNKKLSFQEIAEIMDVELAYVTELAKKVSP